jgi:hypothetical protein
MKHMRGTVLIAMFPLIFSWPFALAANEAVVPKPFVVAPECTPEQAASAIATARVAEPVAACFFLEKWSFRGAALAVIPEEYRDKTVGPEEFRQVRKRVYREQSVRLRMKRDLREALPDQPPSHASTPMSLFVRDRTPLGVFLNESNHIGFADLVPIQPHNDQIVRQERYPVIQLETLVLARGHIFKLIQVSPISGPSTIGEGFRMADDWARRFNGSERLAAED